MPLSEFRRLSLARLGLLVQLMLVSFLLASAGMKTMGARHLLQGCLLVGLQTGCTLETGSTADPAAPEDVAESNQEIVNGSTTFGTARPYAGRPTMMVMTAEPPNANGKFYCSGVALRNNIVLTARHCVTSNGLQSGPIGIAADMAVAHGVPTSACNSSTCQPVREIIAPDTGTDAALLVLQQPLTINGRSYGHAVAVDPFGPGIYLGKDIRVTGYGCSNTANPCGGGGTLRWGQNRVKSMTNFIQQLLGDQLPWDMDSGGPYWNQVSCDPASPGVTQIPTVIGVNSAAVFSTDIRAQGPTALAFRQWVNNEISARTSDLISPLTPPSGTKPSILSYMDQLEPAPGIGTSVPSWSLTTSGLEQSSNFGTAEPDRIGTMQIHQKVYDNFNMSVSIAGTDDDDAGIIFRFIDEHNYYRLRLNQQDNNIVLSRMTPAGMVTLVDRSQLTPAMPRGSVNFTSSGMVAQVIVTGTTIHVLVGKRGTSGFVFEFLYDEPHILTGRVGLYTNRGAGVLFSDLRVTRETPNGTTSLPFP